MFNVLACRPNGKYLTKGLMSLAVLLACSSVALSKPDEVPESAVKDCRFLGKVEGSSGYGKNWNWQDLAKTSAISRAGKMGASHIVWDRLAPVGAFNGTAAARAYECGS